MGQSFRVDLEAHLAIHEIYRRSLWQVLSIYLVASRVVFEVVQHGKIDPG